MDQAKNFPGRENEIIDFYLKHPKALESLKGPVLEDKAVKTIFEKEVKLLEKSYSKDKLEKLLAKNANDFLPKKVGVYYVIIMVIYTSTLMNIYMMKIVIMIMITMVMLKLISMIVLAILKLSTITVVSIMIKEIRKKLKQKNSTLLKLIVPTEQPKLPGLFLIFKTNFRALEGIFKMFSSLGLTYKL